MSGYTRERKAPTGPREARKALKEADAKLLCPNMNALNGRSTQTESA
jgi:hypothetical protein